VGILGEILMNENEPEHEMLFSGLGVAVFITFKTTRLFKGITQVCRNITEIHYNYPAFPTGEITVRKIFPSKEDAHTLLIDQKKIPTGKIAFESEVHQVGVTYNLDELESFAILKKERTAIRPFCKIVKRKTSLGKARVD